MAKRLTEKLKEKLMQCFCDGVTLDELSRDFDCTKATIVRNLKKNLGESKYKELLEKYKKSKKIPIRVGDIAANNSNTYLSKESNNDFLIDSKISSENKNADNSQAISPFIEISPLDYEINSFDQKDLSSVPISDVDFPQIVYLIVDKNIELEIKLLKEYPEWDFLPIDDLNRKTISIFFDLKTAKRFCNKQQKVIKVPNPDVFRIVAPILISRGISRIVSSEKLIAL